MPNNNNRYEISVSNVKAVLDKPVIETKISDEEVELLKSLLKRK